MPLVLVANGMFKQTSRVAAVLLDASVQIDVLALLQKLRDTLLDLPPWDATWQDGEASRSSGWPPYWLAWE